MVTAVTLIKHNILSVHKIIPHRQHGPMDKKTLTAQRQDN